MSAFPVSPKSCRLKPGIDNELTLRKPGPAGVIKEMLSLEAGPRGFWILLTSSPLFIFQEALFITDPCELTYGNTLLLSNAAVSLGSAYITRESLLFFGSPHSASVVFASTFLSLQIKEFRNLGFYVSDSVYGCVFFFLSGFHFFHVVVGLVLLGILSSIPLAFGLSGSLCISQDFFFLFQVLYWHLVELVWQFLFVILYLHSPARPGSAPPRTGAPIPSIMTPRRAGFRELGFETAGPEASPGGKVECCVPPGPSGYHKRQDTRITGKVVMAGV